MGTWIAGAVVLAAIGLAIRKLYTDRKNGKGCGCACDGCQGCPDHGNKQSI